MKREKPLLPWSIVIILAAALVTGGCERLPERFYDVTYEADFSDTSDPNSIRYRNSDDEMVDVDLDNEISAGTWSVALSDVSEDVPAEVILDPAGDDDLATVRILVDGTLEAEETGRDEEGVVYAKVLLRRLW